MLKFTLFDGSEILINPNFIVEVYKLRDPDRNGTIIRTVADTLTNDEQEPGTVVRESFGQVELAMRSHFFEEEEIRRGKVLDDAR